MKKVLIICPFALPNLGGVESHIQKLTDYLTRHQWRVVLITYQPLTTDVRGPQYERQTNLEIYRVGWFGLGWFPKLEPYPFLEVIYLFPGLFLKSLFYYLKHHQEIDCLHAHGFVASLIVKILSKIFPKRTVISTHAIYGLKPDKGKGKTVRWLLKDFDQILAVGEPSKEELEAIGLKNVKVHPNWIDLDVFKSIGRAKAKKSLGLTGFVVLFVGRFLAKKGIRLFLAAAKKNPRVQFVIIGDGPLTDEVKTGARQNKNILYLGKLDQQNPHDLKKIIAYYSAADLLASPVLYTEGFSAVLLEAIGCGTPVLSTTKGCPPSFLDNSVAVLINPTIKTVSEAIKNLFSQPDRLKKMQANCRLYAAKHFSEKNAEIIMKSYE